MDKKNYPEQYMCKCCGRYIAVSEGAKPKKCPDCGGVVFIKHC